MNDVFDSAKRSQVMSRIRGRGNRSTELTLAIAFRQTGVVGWRRHVKLKPKLALQDIKSSTGLLRLSVCPDFIFRTARVAVFVDGCFWHCCPLHSKKPQSNAEFWQNKLEGNVQRDQRSTRALEHAGWIVIRVWEHELKDIDSVLHRVRSALRL